MTDAINGYSYGIESYETYVKLGDEQSLTTITDIFYYNCDIETANNSDRKECLRLMNYELSFYICKLPGQTQQEFGSFIRQAVKNSGNYKESTTLKDSMYFTFGKETISYEISSQSITRLKQLYRKLKTACETYYAKLDVSKLTGHDKLFYENSENPFRCNAFVQDINNVKYYISTKYGIPIVGGFSFKFPHKLETHENMYTYGYSDIPKILKPGINTNDIKIRAYDLKRDNNNFSHIYKNENIDGKRFMTLLAYDIETYTPNNPNLKESEKEVMSIGIGLFDIEDKKPKERICLITKDFTQRDKDELSIKEVDAKHKSYIVSNEYTDGTKGADETLYIILDDEYSLLTKFIDIIEKYSPTFISGFFCYGFDDKYIYDRLLYHYKLNNIKGPVTPLLRQFGFYDIIVDDKKEPKTDRRGNMIHKHLYATFRIDFPIKYDSNENKNNSTWQGSKINSVDSHLSILMTNPKLYTQQAKGSLNNMLSVEGILNPFNNSPLSKTDMTYEEMWNAWDDNRNIYDIAKYCCQDAWIAGTLLLTRSVLIDKIEMSTISCTTISDSIFRAVTHRVLCVISSYAWKNGFLVMDRIINHVDEDNRQISRTDNHKLGGKIFDTRVVVGGQVKANKPGKHEYIMALDYSAMYPSQKEGSNIDTSTVVPIEIINNPGEYGLELVATKEINDMYRGRNMYYFKDTAKKNDSLYDYKVEEFHCEVKNDLSKIKQTYIDYITSKKDEKDTVEILNELRELCPDSYTDLLDGKIDVNKIPQISKNTLYCVQSPKDDQTLKPTIHYSLNEIVLSDLRNLRNTYKKEMSKAKKSGNHLESVRYNAKQLAVKILSNSEYGASQAKFFQFYNPLIGGAVTYGSRQLIGFLSDLLDQDCLYADHKFIDDNKDNIQLMLDTGLMTIDKYTRAESPPVRYSVRRIFDEMYTVINPSDIYTMTIEKSEVVYQDTDSNYYTNYYIKNEYLKGDYTPEAINKRMLLMKAHNEFISSFIYYAIARYPISTGFEGAFIVARYFNVEKKYYGIKWNENMASVLSPEAYEDGILKRDYINWWSPAKTTYPMPDDSYLAVNIEELLRDKRDYVDYTSSNNLKCTGIDLARRDKIKVVNFNHIKLISEDMKYIHYDGNNKWSIIKNQTLLDTVYRILDEFQSQYNTVKQYVDNMLNGTELPVLPIDLYSVEDYATGVKFSYSITDTITARQGGGRYTIINNEVILGKTTYVLKKDINGKYISIHEKGNPSTSRPIDVENGVIEMTNTYTINYDDVVLEKRNLTADTIIGRIKEKAEQMEIGIGRKLTKKEFCELLPQNYKKEFVIVKMTDSAREDMLSGRATDKTKIADKSYTISEMRSDCMNRVPIDRYEQFSHSNECTYEQFINIMVMSEIDIKHYTKSLCNAFSSYILDTDKEFVRQYAKIYEDTDHSNREGNKSDSIKNLIDKHQALLSKELLSRYFTTKTKHSDRTTSRLKTAEMESAHTIPQSEPKWWSNLATVWAGDLNGQYHEIMNNTESRNKFSYELEQTKKELQSSSGMPDSDQDENMRKYDILDIAYGKMQEAMKGSI